MCRLLWYQFSRSHVFSSPDESKGGVQGEGTLEFPQRSLRPFVLALEETMSTSPPLVSANTAESGGIHKCCLFPLVHVGCGINFPGLIYSAL